MCSKPVVFNWSDYLTSVESVSDVVETLLYWAAAKLNIKMFDLLTIIAH